MKKLLAVAPLLVLLSGCALIPKDVEFFQKKVHAVPVYDDSALTHQRQATQFVAQKTQATLDAAETTHADLSVITNASDANTVAQALTKAVGPAPKPFFNDAAHIAATVTHDQVKLNEKLADYREDTAPLVGKKIEGTGLIHMGYFTYLGCVIGFVLLIWFGIRIYGLFNPVVGTAAGVIGRVASSTVTKGFGEVVTGGQQFLQWVEGSHLETDVKDWITNTFKVAHQTAQSPDVQKVVDQLVATPTTSIAPPAPAPVAK